MWNEDAGTSSELTYKNVPFLLSSRGYGIFVPDSSRVSFEVQSERMWLPLIHSPQSPESRISTQVQPASISPPHPNNSQLTLFMDRHQNLYWRTTPFSLDVLPSHHPGPSVSGCLHHSPRNIPKTPSTNSLKEWLNAILVLECSILIASGRKGSSGVIMLLIRPVSLMQRGS